MSLEEAKVRRPSAKFNRTFNINKKTDPKSLQISSVLSSSFASLGIAAKIKEHHIKKAWTGCVGEKISKRAKPSKLIGKTLYCSVSSSPWMTELNYQKSVIISKINKELGENAVSEIILRIGPVESEARRPAPKKPARELTPEEKKFIEKIAEVIKDDALKALVKRVMQKAKE